MNDEEVKDDDENQDVDNRVSQKVLANVVLIGGKWKFDGFHGGSSISYSRSCRHTMKSPFIWLTSEINDVVAVCNV